MVEEKSLSLCGAATEPWGLGCSESPRWESLLVLSLSEDGEKKKNHLLAALQATEDASVRGYVSIAGSACRI